MIAITINSVNRTDDIDQTSVRYRNKLSKAPATLQFTIKGNSSMPDVGQSVVMTQNAVNFFKGTITQRKEKVVKGRVIGYDFVCLDGYFEFDRRLVVKAYNDTTVGAVVTDIVNNFTSGFTLDIPASTPSIETVRFNYEQPSRCLQKLMNSIGWDWNISPTDVVSIFAPGNNAAPHEITDDGGHIIFGSLNFDATIVDLSNIVFVRGGNYEDPIAEGDAVDKYESNGIDNTFPLIYQYSNTEVTVNGTPQTVGVDFIDDPADFDCLYNYSEKAVKFPDGTLSSGDVVRVFGDAKVPLIVQGEDSTSVATYGAREFIEINKNITSIDEAELLVNSLLEQKRVGSRDGGFRSYETGWEVGQTATVNSTIFGKTDDVYKINSVTATLHDHENLVFDIDLIKSSQTDFTDIMMNLIGKEKDNITIADNEVLQRFRKVVETFGLSDEITETIVTSPPYGYAPVTTKTLGKYGFSTYG
jgi:hypothetical protein